MEQVKSEERVLQRSTAASFVLLLVFALAVALRFVLIAEARPELVSDARDYFTLAKNLYDGEGYIQEYRGETPEYKGMTFRAYRMPGYPVVLAGLFSIVGPSPKAAYYLNLLCDLLTIGLVFLGGRALMSTNAALIAASAIALLPLWTVSVLTESLFTTLITALLVSVLIRPRGISLFRSLGHGMLVAGAVFVRPIGLVFLVPAVWAAFRSARPWVGVSLVVLPLLLVLGGWASRNVRVIGSPVLFSTNFGGHNAGDFGIDRRAVVKEVRESGASSEETINRELTRRVMASASEDLMGSVLIFLNRAIDLFSLKPAHELQEIAWKITLPPGSDGNALHKVLYGILRPLYVLAFVGALFSLLARHRIALGVPVVLSFAILHGLVSYGSVRFVSPLLPVFALFATFAVWYPWQRKKTS